MRRAGVLAALLAAACAAPPPPGPAPIEQGRLLLSRGDYGGAERAFRQSIAREGVSAAAFSGIGVAAERRGLLGEAERSFRLAAEISPGSIIAHNNLGAVQYRRGNYAAAYLSFRAAFALSSGTSTVAGHNLGLTEQALARQATREPRLAENPHILRRLGSGAYHLDTAPPAPSES